MIAIDKRTKRLFTIIVFILSAASVVWVLSERNFFVFDDTSILARDGLSSYDDLFSFFPTSVYLDRPIRDIILKWMLQIFGKSYTLHHFFLFLVHLLNVFLVMKVTEKWFSTDKNNSENIIFFASIFAGLFFGAWPKSHMAVQWDSANNDLMGTTFALLCLYFHNKGGKEKRLGFIILQVFFYYLSIRTKEMFYPLPLVLCLYDIWEAKNNQRKWQISLSSIIHLIVMAVFFSGIVYGKLTDQSITVSPDMAYYQDFNPVSLLKNLIKYACILFDVEEGGFVYKGFSLTGSIGTVLLITGFVISAVSAWKKRPSLLLLYITLAFSICPVLPLSNQIHVLYLYYPSVFVGMIIAGLLIWIPSARGQSIVFATISIVLILVWRAPAIVNDRNYWLSTCDMEHDTYSSLSEIEKQIENTTIYVIVPDTEEYTPFFYGPGSIFKFAYDDPSLKTVIVQEGERHEYIAPYLLLEWNNNKVREIERNYTVQVQRELLIESIYPTEIQVDDGDVSKKFGIGIVPSRMDGSFAVLVNGEEQYVFYSEDFISIELGYEDLADKDTIQIQIVDDNSIKSDVVQMDIVHVTNEN